MVSLQKKRAERLFKKAGNGNFNEARKRIKIIKGDITEKNLGIDRTKRKSLIKKIDTVYHCAALCNFVDPLKIVRKVNVQGTKNLLDFALDCRHFGRLKNINYISTVAVAGNKKGIFYEDMLNEGQGFNNVYEQSKFEAEKLVESYKKKEGLSLAIFRPGVIVGDSVTGKVDNFQMFYQFLHILSLGLFKELPVNRNMQYGIVPVDCTAKAIYLISSDSQNNYKTYHLVNPNTISFDFFLHMAKSYFGFKGPMFVSSESYNYKKLTGFSKKLIDYYLPYLTHKSILFDTSNFETAIDTRNFSWPKIDERFLTRLFRYCDKIGYIKRKR